MSEEEDQQPRSCITANDYRGNFNGVSIERSTLSDLYVARVTYYLPANTNVGLWLDWWSRRVRCYKTIVLYIFLCHDFPGPGADVVLLNTINKVNVI